MTLGETAIFPAAYNAMLGTHLLDECFSPLRNDLEELSRCLPNFLPATSGEARAIIEHVFAAGGKRIRPALYFWACRLTGYNGPHLYPMAAVCEYVHTASLLHDDVVDNSSLRRGRPTANRIWGDEAAVLVGDLIYATASEMMAATGSLEIVKTFAQAIRLMSEGELFQLAHLFDRQVDEAMYLKILGYKTAVLIDASCRTAALLAKTSQREQDGLGRFGYTLGVAFQLVDDALDYVSQSKAVGKNTLADLAQGRVTLPVLLLRDCVNSAERSRLHKILESPNVTPEYLANIAALVEKYDTAAQTFARAEIYTQQAIDALAVFPESPERRALENLAQKLVMRTV